MISAVVLLSLIAAVQAFNPASSFGARLSNTKLNLQVPDGVPAGAKPTFDGTWRVPGEHPAEYVLEMESGAQAIVRTHGGNAFTWKLPDGTEIMGKRADAVDITSDDKPYAGGNPHCFPQFGPGALMQHGFARGMTFIPEERAKKMTFDRMIFKLQATDETRAMWNEDFEYRFDVTLRDGSLEWDVIVINLGDQPFDCTLGMHTYLDVSSLSNVRISGPLSGPTFDKLSGSPGQCSSDELVVNGPIDMIYKGCKGPVTIEDSGKGTRVTVSGDGYSDMAIWSPYGDSSMGYDKFICVEPVQVDPVSIPPGKFKETKFYQKITAEKM
mmetsp:Transcript_17506/g.29525  ORF Transcript_17506/g.29525 Transcript_17506/m.29525 type:complete len:326 (-) Transcript_17506:1570-2547(-)